MTDRPTADGPGEPTFEPDGAPAGPAGDDAVVEGTITDLEVQKNDRARRSVYLDGEFAFGVHEDIVAKHGLRVGDRLTARQRRRVEADEQYVKAKQRALSYLAHKARTEEEVRRKLRREDVSDPVVEDVVARLYELNYLDDEAYAHDYARNRFSSKGYGPVRIRRELTERGIDRPLAEDAVAAVFDDESPLEAARAHAEKRWPRLADEDDPRRRKQKLYRYLKRRGFTNDTIYRVIDEFEQR
jgi:regulatory protein